MNMKTTVFKCGLGASGLCQIFRKLLTCYFEIMKNDFRYFQFFRISSNVNRQKTTQFTNFEAPGMLKTAPACIFHRN